MTEHDSSIRIPKKLAVGALVVGVAAGSYGIASAASGNGSSTAATPAAAAPALGSYAAAPPQGGGGQPWGGQRSDETPLTGDALAKVTAAAKAKVSGGTVVRVETDADGNAAYEAHMTDSSGKQVTVYVDKSFKVVSVESRQH